MISDFGGWCALIVQSNNLDFSLVNEITGLLPNKKSRRGIEDKLKTNTWWFCVKYENEIEDALLQLYECICSIDFPKLRAISENLYISVYLQSDFSQISFDFSSIALKKVADLGLDINFSIFSWGGVID
ncbi:hypothetical protein AGMMS49975_21970 [Clostridia bacterium]|nr:hypothetical protein AGMMS49975_21970 [Clostridia bacterium]